MWSEYEGDFGGDGLGEALADLNDAFGGLDGFGKLEGGVKVALPVVLGAGFTFGTAALMDYFITDASTRETWMPYRWLIGAAVGTIAGIILWRTEFGGPVAGIVTIASALTLALVQFVQGYLPSKSEATSGYGAYKVAPAQPVYGSLGAYQVVRPGDLYQSPTYSGLGEGQMVNLNSLGEGSMVDLKGYGGAINPGVFG